MKSIALQTLFAHQSGVQRTDATQPQDSAAAPTRDQAATTSSAVRYADRTSLSSVASATQTALQTDDVRHDRVASLRAAISAGTYQVPSSAVADKLISSSGLGE